MTIDHTVDLAIAALLQTISGLNVVVGEEDDQPNLTTPYVVVYSVIESFEGRTPVYTLLTTIELVSISGQDTVVSVEAVMSDIDTVLTTQPSSEVLAALPTSGLAYLSWEGIPKTHNSTGDRRKTTRQITVFAQAS